MIRIANGASFQPVSVQATEQTETQSPASSTVQTRAVENAQTTAASSVNLRQGAGLMQDGITQKNALQNDLNQKLAVQQSFNQRKEEANQAKEERGSGSLFGTIFGGPIIGTLVGEAVATKLSDRQTKREDLQNEIEKKQEEIKKLQAELSEQSDRSFMEDIGSFFGTDGGNAELQKTETDPLDTIAKMLTPKSFSDPDPD